MCINRYTQNNSIFVISFYLKFVFKRLITTFYINNILYKNNNKQCI